VQRTSQASAPSTHISETVGTSLGCAVDTPFV
jgi:hypothetical protein